MRQEIGRESDTGSALTSVTPSPTRATPYTPSEMVPLTGNQKFKHTIL